MNDRGDIFLGNTPNHERAYLTHLFRKLRQQGKYQRIHIPCVGKFALAEGAIQAGWEPGQVFTSDVSLFSSVAGRALSGQSLDALDIQIDQGLGAGLSPLSPAHVLFALKLATLRTRAKHYYEELMIRDLIRRRDHHIQKLQDAIGQLARKVGTIHYQEKDLWAHLDEAAMDPESIVWVNPPGYARGYDKLYDNGGLIQWNEPVFASFLPVSDHQKLRQAMDGKPALCLRYKYQKVDPEEAEEAVYGGERTKDRIDYILSNRPREVQSLSPFCLITRKPLDIAPYSAPVLPEAHSITPASRIEFRPVQQRHAMYYRDLFAHRLGATLSEQHLLLLVDGYIAGVLGVHLASLRLGQTKAGGMLTVEETYGFTAPSARYPRLNRLLMMLICTKTFGEEVAGNSLHRPAGLTTTCLCQYPELKINRGILQLVARERTRNNLYKLRYATELKPLTYAEVLEEWLRKHGNAKKNSSTSDQASNCGESTLTT